MCGFCRVDPDSELSKDMKKLKEVESMDHILLHLLFEVSTTDMSRWVADASQHALDVANASQHALDVANASQHALDGVC